MLYKLIEDEVKSLKNRVSSLKTENQKLYNQLMETEKSAQLAMWELQEKYDALKDGANNAYGLYRVYKDAEKQGLLIKLSCKVGDTVYYASKRFNDITEYTVMDMIIEPDTVMIDVGADSLINSKQLGKTVFLTREAAGEALKGGSL